MTAALTRWAWGCASGTGATAATSTITPKSTPAAAEKWCGSISRAFLGFGSSFTINADSATDGEVLAIFAGNGTGTAFGVKLGDATSTGGNVTITPTSNYLFFVADNTTTSGADVLLHSLTVTPDAVPETARALRSSPRRSSARVFCGEEDGILLLANEVGMEAFAGYRSGANAVSRVRNRITRVTSAAMRT